MAELGWIPGKFVKNESLRFESRWSTVKVAKSNSVLLKGLEGMQLPIWIAHGEGRYDISSRDMKKMDSQKCLYYVDESGVGTAKSSFNTNGRPSGLTGICSADGRHLAMMPHPERSFLAWQTPYVEECLKKQLQDLGYGSLETGLYFPWLEIFRNAWKWVDADSK